LLIPQSKLTLNPPLRDYSAAFFNIEFWADHVSDSAVQLASILLGAAPIRQILIIGAQRMLVPDMLSTT
jgi:hypothetical protein